MLLDPESTAVKLIDQQTRKEKEKSRLLKKEEKRSPSVLLYVHRDHKDCKGRRAQDVHLVFHTAPELCKRLSAVFVQCFYTSDGVFTMVV